MSRFNACSEVWRLLRHLAKNRQHDGSLITSASLNSWNPAFSRIKPPEGGTTNQSKIIEPLDRIVFSGFHPPGELKPQLKESPSQSVPGDSEAAGGLKLIPARILQDTGQ
jgi:hypothetical protein